MVVATRVPSRSMASGSSTMRASGTRLATPSRYRRVSAVTVRPFTQRRVTRRRKGRLAHLPPPASADQSCGGDWENEDWRASSTEPTRRGNTPMKPSRIAAIALVSSLGGGLVATAAGAAFNDVPAEARFAEHITSVQEAGIASGYSDGSFRPTNPINRQQAAAWINRSASRSALDFADQSAE